MSSSQSFGFRTQSQIQFRKKRGRRQRRGKKQKRLKTERQEDPEEVSDIRSRLFRKVTRKAKVRTESKNTNIQRLFARENRRGPCD